MSPAAARGPREIRSVLATVPFRSEEIEQLRRAFMPADFLHVPSDDADGIARALRYVDVAVLEGDLDARYLAAPKLQWVHCDHSGLTKSARPEVFQRSLVVTGSAGRSAPALAQHGFYFALALAYDAKRLFEMQDAHVWRGIEGYTDKVALWGKTLGIVGFGHTAREMARLGKAFGMRVMVYRRQGGEIPDYVDRILSADTGDTLEPLIENADVVMLATHLSDATYHLFSREQFERMKGTAYIINMSRGPVIDQEALIEALNAGTIAGAGLDVFDQEPLPANSPLWDAKNVIITPHQTPRMPDKTQRSIDMIVDNARRYRAGEPLLNAITERDVYTKGAKP